MSELSQLTGGDAREVAPGYVLSAPRLTEYGVAEDAFARWHVRRARRTCRGWPMELQREHVALAHADVRDGRFTIAMPGYDAMLRSSRGTLLMFWLMLRVTRPDVTLAQARQLLLADEARNTRWTFELLGILPPEGINPNPSAVKKKRRGKPSPPPPPMTTDPPSPSGGGTSTPPSAPADSPPSGSPR